MFPKPTRLLVAFVLAAIPLLALGTNPLSVRGVEGFTNPESVLRKLVVAKRGGTINNFCVVGYKDPDGATTAWVHWVEGEAMIWWEPAKNGTSSLVESRRYLSLRRDVVASEKQLKGSTYLVTRSWVNHVISDCKAVGDKYVIRKTAAQTRGKSSKL